MQFAFWQEEFVLLENKYFVVEFVKYIRMDNFILRQTCAYLGFPSLSPSFVRRLIKEEGEGYYCFRLPNFLLAFIVVPKSFLKKNSDFKCLTEGEKGSDKNGIRSGYWKIPESFIKIIIISHPRDEQSKQCGWNTVISEMKNYAGIWYYFTKARADLSFRYDNKNVKSIAKVFRVVVAPIWNPTNK